MPEASTDARVYLDLYGESGQLQNLYLIDRGDAFNDGQEDSFFFPNPGIGKLLSASIGHDDSGQGGRGGGEEAGGKVVVGGVRGTAGCLSRDSSILFSHGIGKLLSANIMHYDSG